MIDGLRADPSANQDQRERDLFLDALALPTPAERDAFLDHACQGDSRLRLAINSLLANHREDAFLETPATGAALGRRLGQFLHEAAPTREGPGDRIGRYKLIEKIGEGGCGLVYRAEQEEPVRRQVALKVIRLGMDTQQVIARFEAERQALALMDHPNIARVLDGGTTETGRPYFAMDLVEGVKITTYCDQHRLNIPERLNLFLAVCHALQHAHQKGVVHRDIKPSNILVVRQGDQPVPKVIDFGIAKAIQTPLTEKGLVTHHEAFIGTPAYTSPEQAAAGGVDVDTRADIYSLGALLYELLTGQTPFDQEPFRRSTLEEMRRWIREVEPVRPSFRLHALPPDQATVVASARASTPSSLVRTLRGELDWVVLKCLEKDRARRYASANALGEEIERYLENKPVHALRPSRSYQLRKFVRRNRVVVSASLAVALALIAGLAVSSWMAFRATRAERIQHYLRRAVEAELQHVEKLREQAQTERTEAVREAYNSDMNLVEEALSANNYGRVLDLLNRHRPVASDPTRGKTSGAKESDLRQWEWRYFWAQSRNQAAFALPRQDGPVQSLALSPDGRYLVTSPFGRPLQLWDVPNRTKLAEVPLRSGRPGAMAFSHSSRLLAVAAEGRAREAQIQIWSIPTRQFTATLPCPGGIAALAFEPGDQILVSCGRDSVIRRWEAANGRLISEVATEQPARGWWRNVEFSPDGQQLAVAQSDRVDIISVPKGTRRSSATPMAVDLASLAFSPDGQWLALGPSFSSTNTDIELIQTESGNSVGKLSGNVSWVPDLTFTGDGSRLVSAGGDQTVRVWDVPSRRLVSSLHGHLSEIYRLAVSADGQSAVTGCKDGTIFGWDIGEPPENRPFDVLPAHIVSLAFLPGGRGLLTVNEDHSLTAWDGTTLQLRQKLSSAEIPALAGQPRALLVSKDGQRLYVAARRGQGMLLSVFNWGTQQIVTNLWWDAPKPGPLGPRNEDRLIGLVGPESTLVLQSPGRLIQLWNTQTWRLEKEWPLPDRLAPFPGQEAAILSPDGNVLVCNSGNGKAEFLDVQNGTPRASAAIQERPSGMAFSPDGALFATSSVDGTVDLWDCRQNRRVDALRGHLLGIEAVTFSPDGERIASTSHGNEAVKLWDVRTRHEVATLAGAGSLFRHVEFSPDGRWLVAVNVQGQAHFWHAPSLQEIAAASQPPPERPVFPRN